MTSMRAFLVLLALVFLPGLAAAETEREAGPLTRLFPHWPAYLAMASDERDAFTLVYHVSSSSGAGGDIRLWYLEDGDEHPLTIEPNGRVHPPALSVVDANPMLWVNQPSGTMTMRLSFAPLAEPARTLPAAELARAIVQANRAMRRAAGAASLFMPGLRQVRIVFDGPAPEAAAIMADGSRVALPVEENVVFFRPRDRAMRHAERLEFGRAPVHMLLDS